MKVKTMAKTKEALLEVLKHLDINTPALEPFVDSGAETIYLFTVNGEDALNVLRTLNAQVAQTGYSPVLIADRSDDNSALGRLREEDSLYPDEPDYITAEEIIRRSESVDVGKWLVAKREDWASFGSNLGDLMGEWETELRPFKSFANLFHLQTRDLISLVTVALVPTTQAWQIPAYFRFGNFNDCPPPEVHCAVLRGWSEQYGAKLVILTGDTLELGVNKPPMTHDEAFELAEEQFYYCTDIVTQGTGSIKTLASGLLEGVTWYFWWD